MSERQPVYKTYVDWFGHGGLVHGLANWHFDANSGNGTAELSTEQSIRGGESIKVSAGNSGGKPDMFHAFRVTASIDTTTTLWVYVPSGSGNVEVQIFDSDNQVVDTEEVSLKDQWVEVSFTYSVSIDNQYLMQVRSLLQSNDDIYYLGWLHSRTNLDDISCDVLATRQMPDIVYGRDSGRDLDSIRSGSVDLELLNDEDQFTPGNTLSPYFGHLTPGKQIVITAAFEDQIYILYIGFLDNFIINAGLNTQSVSITAHDILARLVNIEINTGLLPSARTGEVFNEVLGVSGTLLEFDDVFDPRVDQSVLFNPYVDSGASVFRWFATGGDTALNVINSLIEAEGPPSLYSVGISGQLIFRDRLARQRETYPLQPTATFSGCDTPGAFTINDDSNVDLGWNDVINRINGTYNISQPAAEYSTVWSQPGDLAFKERSSSYFIRGTVPAGFTEALEPVEATLQKIENPGPDDTDIQSGLLPEVHDYVLVTGDVNIEIASVNADDLTIHDNGTEVVLELFALEDSIIRNISLRAKEVEDESVQVPSESTSSIEIHNGVKDISLDTGRLNQNDLEAISSLALQKRSVRRPTVEIIWVNRDPSYMTAQLQADLGGLIEVDVDQWHINDTLFAIEGIKHELRNLGKEHVTTLYAEQVERTGQTEEPFTFDEEGLGFDDGAFGSSTFTSETVFILGSSQLDSTDILTY